MLNLPLPNADVPIIDPRTGLVSRPWYQFFEAVRKGMLAQDAATADILARLAAAGIP